MARGHEVNINSIYAYKYCVHTYILEGFTAHERIVNSSERHRHVNRNYMNTCGTNARTEDVLARGHVVNINSTYAYKKCVHTYILGGFTAHEIILHSSERHRRVN